MQIPKKWRNWLLQNLLIFLVIYFRSKNFFKNFVKDKKIQVFCHPFQTSFRTNEVWQISRFTLKCIGCVHKFAMHFGGFETAKEFVFAFCLNHRNLWIWIHLQNTYLYLKTIISKIKIYLASKFKIWWWFTLHIAIILSKVLIYRLRIKYKYQKLQHTKWG